MKKIFQPQLFFLNSFRFFGGGFSVFQLAFFSQKKLGPNLSGNLEKKKLKTPTRLGVLMETKTGKSWLKKPSWTKKGKSNQGLGLKGGGERPKGGGRRPHHSFFKNGKRGGF